MTALTALPADSFVTAAFAELLEDVTGLLSAAQTQKPRDKEEVAFWRRQMNALNKAESYWTQGIRPTMASVSYFIASASRPGALIHRLSRVGGILVCSCEAGQKGALCWHHMLINVLERAAELAALDTQEAEIGGGGDEGKREKAKGKNPNPDLLPSSFALLPLANPIPHAAEAAAWLAGQQQLAQRLAATAQLMETLRAAQSRTVDPAPARRLGVRLVQARKKSAYFTSAFYLAA